MDVWPTRKASSSSSTIWDRTNLDECVQFTHDPVKVKDFLVAWEDMRQKGQWTEETRRRKKEERAPKRDEKKCLWRVSFQNSFKNCFLIRQTDIFHVLLPPIFRLSSLFPGKEKSDRKEREKWLDFQSMMQQVENWQLTGGEGEDLHHWPKIDWHSLTERRKPVESTLLSSTKAFLPVVKLMKKRKEEEQVTV